MFIEHVIVVSDAIQVLILYCRSGWGCWRVVGVGG